MPTSRPASSNALSGLPFASVRAAVLASALSVFALVACSGSGTGNIASDPGAATSGSSDTSGSGDLTGGSSNDADPKSASSQAPAASAKDAGAGMEPSDGAAASSASDGAAAGDAAPHADGGDAGAPQIEAGSTFGAAAPCFGPVDTQSDCPTGLTCEAFANKIAYRCTNICTDLGSASSAQCNNAAYTGACDKSGWCDLK